MSWSLKIIVIIFQPTDTISNLAWNHEKTLHKRKGGLSWLSDVVRANDVGDVIYDVTPGNVQHAAEKFQQNTVTFIFLKY